MACDAQTLLAAAAQNGYYALEDRSLLMAILFMLCQSSGGTGGAQIVTYTADPNAEALTPLNTTAPAVAYQKNGAAGVFVWDVTNQIWV